MRFLSIILIAFLASCEQPSTDGTASTKQFSHVSLSFEYLCASGQTIKVSYPTEPMGSNQCNQWGQTRLI